MIAANQSRQNVIRLIIGISFSILIIRLLFLQLASTKYDLLAIDNAVSKKVIFPERGIVFDRKGRSILENTRTYDLMILPTQLKGLDTQSVCTILKIDMPEFKERVLTAIIKN
jgi:penicillin-binding protein 2